MARQKSKSNKKHTSTTPSPKMESSSASLWKSRRGHMMILAILSIVLYANTVGHDYTQDDAIVIYDNEFTTQGISGIPSLFKYDTFRGFFKTEGKDKLVQGGRYRPLTPAMFAVEYSIFGASPWAGHLFNTLWYALLVVVLYLTLERLLLLRIINGKSWLILLACLLYALHPTHTEAVANIKGRDEIITLLGSLVSLYYILKSYDTGVVKYMWYAMIAFFLALLSKENAITFLAVIPLALYMFRDAKIGTAIKYTWPAVVATVAFIALRTAVIGFDMGGTPMELMNNPFLEWTGDGYRALSKAESLPTMIYCLGKYLQLLIFPHPLTHDYYPREIEIMSWGHMQVILSLVIYVALAIWAIRSIRRKSIISFCIIFFVATISIVSNIVFPIGTNMSERFLFMPSVGFALALAYIIYQLYQRYPLPIKILTVALLLAWSTKTITRNMVWTNDYTLFTTDVHTSTRSAKLQNAAGGTKIHRASKLDDGPEKTKLLNEATDHLSKAIEIHPNYKNAMLLLGNANYYREDFDASIAAYERILRMYPNDEEAVKNLAISLRDGGRYYGEQKQDLAKAEQYLQRSISLNADDAETYRLLGITNGVAGRHEQAIQYFKKQAELSQNPSGAYVNLFTSYQILGDTEKANEMKRRALEIDPNAFDPKIQK